MTIIDDAIALEEIKQFTLTLSNPDPSAVLIGQDTTSITIQDDDCMQN